MLTHFSLKLFETYRRPYHTSMIELGNQIMDVNEELSGMSAKKYFEGKGWSHYSIDLNGKDGAIPVDLAKPIEEKLVKSGLSYFDVLTDWGTSEHVSDLYQCFKNCHNLVKPGGMMFHENPMVGHFTDGHHAGAWRFTQVFYLELAKLCNYEILQLGVNAAYGNTKDGLNVHCVMICNGGEFISEEEFSKLSYTKE